MQPHREPRSPCHERRGAIVSSLKERNLLTPELDKALAVAETLTKLEDLYLPYRPKKRTRATIAKEKGLELLSELIWAQDAATNPVAAAQAAYILNQTRKRAPHAEGAAA